jgi:ABC-type sugar transport system substrate-binding protein
MTIIQKPALQAIKDTGGKVITFDKDVSHTRFVPTILSAQRKLARMGRFGSRRVKVAVRRNGSASPVDALAAVRAASRKGV